MGRSKMKFLFVTLFPEQIEQGAGHSIIKRALDAGLIV
jgi:tRNA (guanine37-N1)-methyltransferase